ncbi:unnamed protein product, partial [Urochloa humidicola]
ACRAGAFFPFFSLTSLLLICFLSSGSSLSRSLSCTAGGGRGAPVAGQARRRRARGPLGVRGRQGGDGLEMLGRSARCPHSPSHDALPLSSPPPPPAVSPRRASSAARWPAAEGRLGGTGPGRNRGQAARQLCDARRCRPAQCLAAGNSAGWVSVRLQATRGGSRIELEGLYSGLGGNLAGVLLASAIFVGVYEPTKRKTIGHTS